MNDTLSLIDAIHQKALDHAQRYSTFKVDRFMAWISTKSVSRQQHWLARGIAGATRNMRHEMASKRSEAARRLKRSQTSSTLTKAQPPVNPSPQTASE